MKLSNLTAKLTCIKQHAFRTLALATVAGAALAAAPAAQAQHVSFGVRVGGPVYVAPAPVYGYPVYRGGYYAENRYWADRRAYDDYRRHEDWERHERWERDHYYDHRGYDRDHDFYGRR